MRVNVLLVSCPFLQRAAAEREKRAWMCSSLLGSLSRSSGGGQEDCFLFIYSLSYNQSSFSALPRPDLGDIPVASPQCENRREQLKQLHLTEYIIQKMSDTVTDQWSSLFIVPLFRLS